MRNLKILGLSLLALVGVMAVSASAAQAKWLLLNPPGTVVDLLELTGTINLGWLIVPKLLDIHCTGGTFTAHLHTVNAKGELEKSGPILLGSGTAIFTNCLVYDAALKENTNCKVNSPGKAAGTIVAKGEGTGAMEGTTSYAVLKSSEFTFLEISGALCPLNEESAEVSGSAKLTLDGGETCGAKQTVLLDEVAGKLFYGENSAELTDGAGGPIKGTAERANASEWCIELKGL